MSQYTRALLPFSVLLSGCVTYFDNAYVGMPSYEVTRTVTPEGRSDIYRLHLDGASSFLDVDTEYDKDVVRLGMTVWEIDRRQARELDLTPYIGLLVREVRRDSPAEHSGLRPGDILLSVNGEPVIYRDQYQFQLERLPAGEPATLQIRRGREERTEIELSIVPHIEKERVRATTRVPLEVPAASRGPSYAGMMLRVIPEEWSKRMYDDRNFTAVVGGVVLGSPAYLAGLRAGDVIESLDGRPVSSADEIQRVLREKGSQRESVRIAVMREAGNTYETDVALRNYAGSTEVKIPLVFGLDNDVRRSDWSLGPLSIVADYENRYEISQDRTAKTRGSYSMLFGLFKYSWRPGGSRTRLLWIISFEG